MTALSRNKRLPSTHLAPVVLVMLVAGSGLVVGLRWSEGAGCSDPAFSIPLVTVVHGDGLTTTQSATIVSPDGLMLTQWSWVTDARRILATLPGQPPIPARLVNASEGRDLALLSLESPARLCPVSFGDPSVLRIGQSVRSYGYPLADALRSEFFTSEQGRIMATRGSPVRSFQSDLVVDPGFAGSPIVDDGGKVIGIQRLGGGRAVWRDTWADTTGGLPALIDALRDSSSGIRPVDTGRAPALALQRPAGRVVTMAVHVSLSGLRAVAGRSILEGVTQAVAELGTAFRAHGVDVRVTAVDDRGDSATAIANARDLAGDPSVLLVIGHSSTSICQDVAPMYAGAGLPMITPACEVATFTGVGLRNVFRVIGRDDVQGAAAARFAAATIGARTAYVAYEPVNYGLQTAATFWWEGKRLGMRMMGLTPVDAGNLRAVVASAAAARPDVVYYSGEAPGAARFLNALRASGSHAVLVGPDGLDSSEFGYLAGRDAAGAYYTVLDGPPRLYRDGGTFAKHLRARTGHEPGPFAALAYDAAGIGLQAIASAGLDYRRVPSRADVLAALHDSSLSFSGVTGTVRFMTNGDRVQSPVFVMQVGSAWRDWPENRLMTTIIP